MAEKWTKTSAPPPSWAMKPKPFSPLNHFTVPCAMYESSLQVLDLRTVRGPADLTAPGERRPSDAVSRPPTVPAGVQDTNTETERPDDSTRGAAVSFPAVRIRRRESVNGSPRSAPPAAGRSQAGEPLGCGPADVVGPPEALEDR